MSGEELLVVAGEPSGDRIAALVVRALGGDARAFGMGGSACRAAGVEIVADAERLSAMGIGDVVSRLPEIGAAVLGLCVRVRRAPPRAALLVNFTELNQRLGRWLKRRGVRVLWCVAPQVWAWRRGRLRSLSGALDRMAVILPFEEALWRDAGYDARYVGHPSLEISWPHRGEVRAQLGIAGGARAVAVLPGSRAGEIARLAEPLCAAAAELRTRGEATEVRLVAAGGLAVEARRACERIARAHEIAVVPGDPEHGAAPLLGAFDAALCASGTASLEAALAGALPVVAYRLDRAAYAIARRVVRTPHIALPNVLLGRRACEELVQDEVTVPRIAAAGGRALRRGEEGARLAAELRGVLAVTREVGATFGERVAEMLRPWLVG